MAVWPLPLFRPLYHLFVFALICSSVAINVPVRRGKSLLKPQKKKIIFFFFARLPPLINKNSSLKKRTILSAKYHHFRIINIACCSNSITHFNLDFLCHSFIHRREYINSDSPTCFRTALDNFERHPIVDFRAFSFEQQLLFPPRSRDWQRPTFIKQCTNFSFNSSS